MASFDTGGNKYGKVHSGFYNFYKYLEPQLIEILDRANAKNKTISITGHSLGGAMATIAGAELTLLGYEVSEIYTYGEPKVGRQELIEFHHNYIPGKHLRFCNNRDIVTRVPPRYQHSGQLYWFDEDGNLRGSSEGLIKTSDAALDPYEEELNNDEFDQLCEKIQLLNSENTSKLPLSDAQIDELLADPESQEEGLFDIGDKLFGRFTDHKIKNYIKIIRQYL